MNVSVDGFVETPDRALDWGIVDEEVHTFFNDQAREADAFLYGRRMYELMSGYWPTADADASAPPYEIEFARIWKATPKVVFSKSLDHVEWNARLVKGDIADEVSKLKAQPPGKDLFVSGATIASALIRLGLVDEFRPVVHPVVLGAGTPFLPTLDRPLELRLVETRTFGSGVIYLRYERADGLEPR